MTAIVLTNAKLFVDTFDLSGLSNELRAAYAADPIDVSTFAPVGAVAARGRIGGLQTFKGALGGFVSYGAESLPTYKTTLGANMAPTDTSITVGSTAGGAIGDILTIADAAGAFFTTVKVKAVTDGTHFALYFPPGGSHTFVTGALVNGPEQPQQSDDTLFANLSVADKIFSYADRGAEGDAAYFLKSIQLDYTPGAQIGQALAWKANIDSRGTPLLRGTMLANRIVAGTANAPSNAGLQLGAVAAGKSLYAALHVFGPVAGTNPTLNVIVQSNVDNTFGAPTTRITFTQATGKSAQYATPVAGPITDTWWRAAITLGGTVNPSFPMALILAIQ